jgi:hypothetical protein
MVNKKIKTIEELKKLASKDIITVRLIVSNVGGFGGFNILKKVSYDKKIGMWLVSNKVGDSYSREESFSEYEFKTQTSILEVMDRQGLFLEDSE